MTTTAELVAATHETITDLGARFMLDPQTAATGKTLGFSGLSFYVTGRGGVLGDVHPDVVAAAFGYMQPDWLAKWWAIGTAVMPARKAADVYTDICQNWGRAHLGGTKDVGRLAELLQKVSVAADPGGLSLFAGWRAQGLPADPAGAAAQLLHVLREFRGSAHLCAVRAAGLSPLEAMTVKYEGALSKMWGYEGVTPPEVDPLRGRRADAEAMTDRICEQAYGALSPSEGDDLLGLLRGLVEQLGDARH